MILLIVESVIMGWDLFYPFNEGKGKGNDNEENHKNCSLGCYAGSFCCCFRRLRRARHIDQQTGSQRSC